MTSSSATTAGTRRRSSPSPVASWHPDFALEYDDDLPEELYHLTYGQPYLLQRLCWELVNRWNERFLKDGEVRFASELVRRWILRSEASA